MKKPGDYEKTSGVTLHDDYSRKKLSYKLLQHEKLFFESLVLVRRRTKYKGFIFNALNYYI